MRRKQKIVTFLMLEPAKVLTELSEPLILKVVKQTDLVSVNKDNTTGLTRNDKLSV